MWVESSQGVVLAVHELSSSDRPSVPARLNVATEIEGPDFRPTIIFCHATGLHAHTWLPVAQELEDDFRCVALDFRGHGYTKTPEGISFSWAEMTQDLLAVATALRQVLQRGDSTSPSPGSASSPHVPLLAVGHSMGGAAIVHAQRAMPGLFEKAWLFEPILPIPSASREFPSTPEFPPTDNSSFLADISRRRRFIFASRQEALDRYNSRPPLNVFRPDALHNYVQHGFEDLPDGRVALRCLPEHEAQTFEGALVVEAKTLAELELPVAIAVSGDDSQPAAFSRRTAQAIPQAELLSFSNLGHFGPQEDPTQIATSIREWFG